MCIPYGKTFPLVQKINIATYTITFDLMFEKLNLTFTHYLLMWIDNSFILQMYTHGKKDTVGWNTVDNSYNRQRINMKFKTHNVSGPDITSS